MKKTSIFTSIAFKRTLLFVAVILIAIYLFSYKNVGTILSDVEKEHVEFLKGEAVAIEKHFKAAELEIHYSLHPDSPYFSDKVIKTTNPQIIRDITDIVKDVKVKTRIFTMSTLTFHPRYKQSYTLSFKSNYDTYYTIRFMDKNNLVIYAGGQKYLSKYYKIIGEYDYEKLFTIIDSNPQHFKDITNING